MMDFQDLNKQWERVCDYLISQDGADESRIIAFFARLHPQAMSRGFLMLTADTDFMKQWIERYYLTKIKDALKQLYGVDFSIMIEVDTSLLQSQSQPQEPLSKPEETPRQMPQQIQEAPPASTQAQSTATPQPSERKLGEEGKQALSSLKGDGSNTPASLPDDPTVLSKKSMPEPERKEQSSLKKMNSPTSQLTFENFVIGDSNHMAYSMSLDVAERPGETALNPLFIYGKSGLGKTHLLRAIQNYIDETEPSLTTVYVDSADLLNDFTEASIAHDREKSSFKNFKTRYQQADILLIDDIQSLQGKRQTLEIVFEVFNKLIGWGKQVVLSADRAPKNIDIDERYQSRFSQGGIVDIQPPSVETKLGIIKSFINQYRVNEEKQGLQIPEEVQLFIAENSGSNIRELKGAITKVIYHMEFFEQPNPNVDDIRIILDSFFTPVISHTLTVEDIQKEVESFFKISHKDLVGPSRAKEIVQPRQIAIYLCRQMTDLPFNTIAKRFNRDHSTAMHSVDVMEKLMREDRGIQEEVETLKHIIRDL